MSKTRYVFSWSLALEVILLCLVGGFINVLPAPFDSSGIVVFGCGAAVYAALRFTPYLSIPIALLICSPLWFSDGDIIGKECLTLLPIVISLFGYQKSPAQVVKIGGGVWSIVFVPVLLLEHYVDSGAVNHENLNLLISGVLVTWISGAFGLVTGHFVYLATHGLRRNGAYVSEKVKLNFLFSYFFSGCFFIGSMAVIYLSVSLFQQQQERQIQQYMLQRIAVLQQQLSDFIEQHQSVVTATAKTLSGGKTQTELDAASSKQLSILAEYYPNFITFLIADKQGDITHTYPTNLIEKVKSGVSSNVANRPYFFEVMQSGKPYLSDVFQGRGFGSDPIVAISAPIKTSRDDTVGIVEGSLSLKSFTAFDELSLDGFSLLIEDRKGDVVFASNELNLKPLGKAPFYECEPQCDVELDNGIGGKNWLRFEGDIPQVNWTLSYFFNREYLQASMSNYLMKDLVLLLLLSIFGTFAGFLVARMISMPLKRLIRYIASFDHKSKPGSSIPSEEFHIQELTALNNEFISLEQRLLAAFDELGRARATERQLNVELGELNQSLEVRIEEKTQHLESALKSAEAANIAKTQFLANMSHEIRTPMNGIIGSCELMSEYELPGYIASRANTISRSATNLLHILDSILDWSKIESGKMVADYQDTPIRELLSAAKELFTYTANIKEIEIHLFVDDSVPALLTLDSGKVGQVVNNLLSNAIKFTNGGTVTITANYADNSLSIGIEDTGVGISKDKLHTIFGKFEQADASTTRDYGGTGLGLAISRGIVELLGGEMCVESTLDNGSTFTFYIPCKESTNRALAKAANTEPSIKTIPNNTHILLAEDNDINAEIVMEMLSSANVRCIRAKNGQDTLEAAKKYPFDVILMDCQMPVMDGLTAASQIRKHGINKDTVRIIALTANAFEEDRIACLNAGMDAYLSKPIRKRVLFNCIANELAAV
ncbi:ATP-binding protein [Alteromonas sp. BMJM2]|uniref:ATP-binding protein n=1 Tax=Alteromonas sp. BMJM2 TaxID=2954241 RepID=UPI0022B4C173|nr:ATP-binding protein [Alteromonas sp. BMJM2]